MDILKKAQRVQLRGSEENPRLRNSHPKKQPGRSSKKQWGFISAGLIGLCALSFVLAKTYLSPFTAQPDQAFVSTEGKPSPPTAEKRSPEPLKKSAGQPKDEDLKTSGQALNPSGGRTASGQEGTARPSVPPNSRPDDLQKEKGPLESNSSPGGKKRAPLIIQTPREAIPSRIIGVEEEGGKEMSFPIGRMISQGNVRMEVKEKIWRTVESPYAPVLKGNKIKVEQGTATISLSNNSLIEVRPNSLLSFEQEAQLNLLEGGIHFKIPSTAQMTFKIGALSVTKPYPLISQKGTAKALTGEEETHGSLFLFPDGSLGVRSVHGSLLILDHENRVLTTPPSNEPITIPQKILSGKEPWKMDQRTSAMAPEIEEKIQAPQGEERGEVDDLEKYLIEFSRRLNGKELPVDLDAQKFFPFLATVYPHPDIIEKVKRYPVKVQKEGKSYILTLCDKQSVWMLYKDLGATTDRVDNVYDPGERRCREAIPLYWFLAVPAAAITGGVVWYEVDKHNDDPDRKPLCP